MNPKRQRTRWSSGPRAAIGALLAALVILGPVGGAALAQDATPSGAADEPVTLTVGLSYDLYTSNPFRVCGCGAEYEWLALNYDMLLRFDQHTLEPAPAIATEIPTKENGGLSADGRTWTFKIREGMTWHDGEPLTAQDVLFTYNFVVDNRVGAYNNYIPSGSTFSAPNDTTFVWTMEEPSLAPLAPPYIPILPEHVWSEYDGDLKSARQVENIPAVGSGPFQLVEWKQGQLWRLEANEDYWDGAPQIDELVFLAFDNQESMALALREGEVDIVSGLIPNLAATLDQEENIDVHEVEARGFLNFAFNLLQGGKSTSHPALQDLTVREAIAHAIDKQALIDRVLQGTGTIGSSIMPASSRWHWEPSPEQVQEFDLELANQMLDEGGYDDTDDDGVREMPGGGEPLQLEVLSANSVPSAGPSAKLIASWLDEIGIDVVLKPSSDGQMNDAWGSGGFDAYLWGWYPDPDPDFILSVFTTDQCGSWSDGCYSDPDYDRMYEEQRSATDPAEREEIVAQMQEHLYEDVAEVILYYEADLQAYRTDRFTGWVASPEPDGYYVFGYLPYGYMDVHPVSGETAASNPDSRSIPLWVWGAGIVVVVGLVYGVSRMRRRSEDERI